MNLTIQQINRLASQQLTPEEILLLKLRLTLDPSDLGIALGVSRQAVHQALNRAMAKVELQWSGAGGE